MTEVSEGEFAALTAFKAGYSQAISDACNLVEGIEEPKITSDEKSGLWDSISELGDLWRNL